MSLTDLSDLTSVFVDPTAYADEERFHAACRVLRREHPVVRVESERYRPFWAVTRHADVMDVEHKAFRGIAASWFRPRQIRALEDRIRALAGRYVDHLADLGGSCDFVQEV